MQRRPLQRLVLLGAAGLALSSVSVAIHAVTATDVVCNGCVQSSDIANNTVASVDILDNSITSADILNNTITSADILNNTITSADILNNTILGADISPSITLGTSTAGGVLRLRTLADPAAYVLEANVLQGIQRVVRIGRGGAALTNEDVNLQVIDPFFAASATEPVMDMDALSGTLYLGSGDSTTAGQGGELFIEDGTGRINVWLYGYGSAYLGGPGRTGYLALDDATSSWSSVVAYGFSGNVSNKLDGNGLVKAWARINADGTVASCYRCDSSETQKLGTGVYEVDFTPVGTDVSGRPWTCSLGTGAVFGASGEISCVQRSGDASSLYVDINNAAGAGSDQAYTVVLY